jgi:TrpR family trp operon transcriptional repressor
MSDFNDFVELVYKTDDRDLLEDLLVGITTDKERGEIAQRLEIVKRLIAGEPQHKIAAALGVGIATVTRGSKELGQGSFKALRRPS